MISDKKIDEAAAGIEVILFGMIVDGADAYALQRAIFQALATISRDRALRKAASIASELSTRLGQAIAALKGGQP